MSNIITDNTELKNAILGLAGAFNQGKTSFKDGIQFSDAIDFFDDYMAIQKSFEEREAILAQLNDLDLIEQSGIVGELESMLNIPNESAKRKVIKVINWLIVTYDVVDEFTGKAAVN